MKTTVLVSALMLMLMLTPSVAFYRGVAATEEDTSGDVSAKQPPPGERVHLPIKGVEFYARSIRLKGTTVTATGDLRARLERFPRVEIRAASLEYRVGGDKVKLREPTWTYPLGGAEASRRLKVRAESATFRIKDETVVARSIRVATQDGELSFEAESGTWRSKSRDCLLESVEGDVFTATDTEGRGSRSSENFRVKISQATVRISPDLTLDEIRLDRITGEERRNSYVFEAKSGVLDCSHAGRLREALLRRVKVVGPGGQTIDCDELSYRPPAVRSEKKRTPASATSSKPE